MAASAKTRSAVSRAGIKTRYLGADHPETLAARADLAAAQIEDDIRRRLASAPPLTDDAADRLAALLRGER